MQKLIDELSRLYLPAGVYAPAALARHALGQAPMAVSLAAAGTTRAMCLVFDKRASGPFDQHWTDLCQVANALQQELGLPAPAVSIAGAHGFALWLSLAAPVPVTLAQQFMEQVCAAYAPDQRVPGDAASADVELPPRLHPLTGRWAAFINPGLGASFAEEAGLDMAPPEAGQLALLEKLKSVSEEQFRLALDTLKPVRPPSAAPAQAAQVPGLLLKDATLDDIVRHLHALRIEPTFRHLLPPGRD